MNEHVTLTWEEYYSKFPRPKASKWPPEKEAAIDNSPYFKKQEERARIGIMTHPLPWGKVILSN